MKMFWSILLPIAIPAYLLGAGALASFGYNSYFGIPGSYVSTSATFYAVFALNLYTIAVGLIATVPWWGWLINLLIVGVIAYLLLSRIGRILLLIGVLFLLVRLLFGMVDLGIIFAKTQTQYEVPAAGCAPIGPAANYVIPVIAGDNVIVVPVDKNNTISGDFIIKPATDFTCGFAYKNIGEIKD